MKIEGKVALVFGAAEGIGKSYVEALLQKGAKVCFGDVQKETGEKVEEEFAALYDKERVIFTTCDVGSKSDVENMFRLSCEKWGPPDIVIDNAAIMQEFDWEKAININYGGVVRVTLQALKLMGKDHGGKGGVIVHTASIVGLYPLYFSPVYCGTKHAIIGFMRSWAHPKNYTNHGCRINAVCPVTVDTPLLNKVRPDTVYFAQEKVEALKAEFKLKPSEVAEAMIMCVENESLNGQCVKVMSTGVELHQYHEEPKDVQEANP